jgi:hypothetical protein
MTDVNDLCDEKNQMLGQDRIRQSRKRIRLRRKGVMEEEGFKFFMKVRSRHSKR